MATQFADLTKSASGLLKDSFPFDSKLVPRSHFTLKASTKSADSSVNTTFEQAGETAEAKIEASAECKARNLALKESFSTKNSTFAVTATFTDKLVQGSKASVETKLSRADSSSELVFIPTFDLVNDSVALRLKGELHAFKPISAWTAEVSATYRREKVQLGAQAKLAASALAGVGFTGAYSSGECTFTLGANVDPNGPKTVTGSFFTRFNADNDGRFASQVQIPTDLQSPDVRAALLFNVNKDTTAGSFVSFKDSKLNFGSSLKVKVNDNLTVSGSLYAPFDSLTASSAGRVFGLGVEFSS